MWGCGFVEDGRLERGSVWLWVCWGGAVGLGLWRWGYRFVEVVSVGLWVCEGWPVRTWQCLVVGLFRWGCVFGIVDCGGGVVACFRRKRRKESREKRRRNRKMNNTKKEKKKKQRKEREREK